MALRYECTICHERFPTSFSRSSHLSKTHLDLLCRQCNRYYLSSASLQQHYRNDTGHPSCPVCEEGFPTVSILNAHLKSAHPPVECGPCGVLFKQQSLLDAHLRESGVHPICVECNIGFQDALSFDQHILLHHQAFYCDICAVGFQSTEHLHEHFRYSDWERHPTCVICNTAFKDHDIYNEHMVSRHPPTPIVLPVTPRLNAPSPPVSSSSSSTPTSSSSMSSPILVHAPQVHPCLKCNKNFMRMEDLLWHYRDSPSHPTCVQCSMGFFDDLAFLEHKITTHKNLRPSRPSSVRSSPSPQGVFRFDEDLRSPDTQGDNSHASFIVQPAPQSPLLPSISMSKRSKGKARRVPKEFAVTASPFPPESPALDYECVSGASQIPSGLDGTFEVIPEANEPTPHPECPRADTQAEDSSPSYESAPSDPELGSPVTSSTEESSPILMYDIPVPDSYSPQSAQNNHFQSLGGQDSEYLENAATRIPGDRISSRPLSQASDELDRRSEAHSASSSGRATPDEEQQTRYHTPEVPTRLSSRSSSRISGRSSRRSSRTSEGPRSPNPPTNFLNGAQASKSRQNERAAGTPLVQALPWNCRICLKEPNDPTATICGHIFCHSCIVAELVKSLQCPTCRRMLLIPLFVEN